MSNNFESLRERVFNGFIGWRSASDPDWIEFEKLARLGAQWQAFNKCHYQQFDCNENTGKGICECAAPWKNTEE